MTINGITPGKLGKQDYRYDDRTLKLAAFLAPEPHIPTLIPPSFDFDHHRSPFQISAWGNFEWGDCVLGGRANHIVRLERIEHRHSPVIPDEYVIASYQGMTGAKKPGDANDQGLVVLDALNDWRHIGWNLRLTKHSKSTTNLRIEAFGELDPLEDDQLRAAIFLLDGIQMGLALPITASRTIDSHVWDVDTTLTNGEGKPGSWGGHLVYCKRYDSGGIYCMTWGIEIYMTNAFVHKYCDEAWGVVDALESHSKFLDVTKMREYLRQIGVTEQP
jgi:hypothetical protein